jgi:hypothetical protein
MLNVKKIINYKMLRDQGKKVVDIKGDEVIQLVSRGEEDIKIIVNQTYFMELLSAYNQLLIRAGLKEEKTITIDEARLKEFEKKLDRVLKVANADEEK